MVTATIFEAKTNLSALVKKAQAEETVIITSGREKTPVVKLLPVQPVIRTPLGTLEIPGFVPTDAIFEQPSDDELSFGKVKASESVAGHPCSALGVCCTTLVEQRGI